MESKLAGADGVKFQMWRASDLYTTDHPEWNNIIKSELSLEQITELKQYADEVEIDFFCSACSSRKAVVSHSCLPSTQTVPRAHCSNFG